MRLPSILIIFLLITSAAAFQVSPANPNPGDTLTITGTSSPSQEVTLRSSFSMDLPVSSGQYDYQTTVTIPQKPNRITVTAENVQDFSAGFKFGIWITKSFEPSGGKVRLSQADVPSGQFTLRMFGSSLPGSSAVPVSVQAETRVVADNSGNYKLNIDTSGVPEGEYRIDAAGESKTVYMGQKSSQASNIVREAPDSELIQTQPATDLAITSDVIRWYANLTGLDPQNPDQLKEAEEHLNARLDAGYWKIIARGQPLTEQAGDCMSEYCLVRGTGACTACREKDILIKGNQTRIPPEIESSVPLRDNQSQPKSSPPDEQGIWDRITRWFSNLLAIL
jgi:hypothetical protein